MTFLRFGLLAWGGPVAQIGMIRDELVGQKGWISPDKFKRVLAVYQALPGPEAHELCVYFGLIRRGGIGGLLAGLGFMLPGLVFMLLLSWAYTLYGATVLLPLFVGIAPAVAALIIRAVHRISGHVLHGRSLLIAGTVAVMLTLLQVHFLLVFVTCGLWQVLYASGRTRPAIAALILFCGTSLTVTWLLPASEAATTAFVQPLFLEGLKAGMLSFGGAYTVIPFFQESMVGAYPTITEQSFLDGIALSNVIPAPLVIFGTYLGFLADGLTGALWVTIGIFLPAFAFTLIGHHQLEKIIENPTLHGLLDGISAGVVGLLVVTALQICLHAVASPLQAVIFSVALATLYLWKWRWSIPVMILGCGVFGYGVSLIG
ncbi:MAG: chromate efflux transporter [Rickettsiales bacterium]|nr:chromate efflux transporter [Rickettsiales bacterium]